MGGDLLPILATWPENEHENRFKFKIAKACLQLLAPLTMDLDEVMEGVEEKTQNQSRHLPFLKLAQVEYKRLIINFDEARILHTLTRVALPAMATSSLRRKPDETAIINLLLLFLKNTAAIEPTRGVVDDGDEAEISRSALIDAFQYQDILLVLLTLAGDKDFRVHDVRIMEILFHLVKGVDIPTLFMNEAQKDTAKADELASLRTEEADMHSAYKRTAPTRHGRFGTMVWVQRPNKPGQNAAISGQNALMSDQKVLEKWDANKIFNKPMTKSKAVMGPLDFNTKVRLNQRANKSLREFVEEFLDSGFNTLFSSLRKAVDQEAERVLGYHKRQFFYLTSWFLEAERVRRANQRQAKDKAADLSFGLVAAVTNHEVLITLQRSMSADYEDKNWADLEAEIKCFSQILLTVQDMFESPHEEDQEIAENALSRIFYEENVHNMVSNCIRDYNNQGYGYLDACTELGHVYLRILEYFSKENQDLQVRSRRKAARRKKATSAVDEGENPVATQPEDDDADENERASKKVSRERKFNFQRFSYKFCQQGVIDTYLALLTYYTELKPEQLKRVHRFLHRIAFKMDMSIMLFRLSHIALLQKLIKGPEGLISGRREFKEWQELTQHLFRKLTKLLHERPELFVEMLFSKTATGVSFLLHGDTHEKVQTYKAASKMEVKPSVPEEEWIGTVVSAMLERNEAHLSEWFKIEIRKKMELRKEWETDHPGPAPATQEKGRESVLLGAALQDLAIKGPPKAPVLVLYDHNSANVRKAMLKNGFLRLLFTLCGLSQIGDEEVKDGTSWVLPTAVTSTNLEEKLRKINETEFDPLSYEDGHSAEWHVRYVSPGSGNKRAAFDDDASDGIDDDDDLEALFETGGPTSRKGQLAELAERRKSKKERTYKGKERTEEELDEERLARKRADAEKLRKIKSQLFAVDDESDEEADAEFFKREEEVRKKNDLIAKGLLESDRPDMFAAKEKVVKGKKNKKGKLRKRMLDEDEDESEERRRPSPFDESGHRTPPRVEYESDSDGEEERQEMEVEAEERPKKRSLIASMKAKAAKRRKSSPTQEERALIETPTKEVDKENADVRMVDLSDSEEDDVPVVRAPRKRIGAFIDSDE